jgi:hypothetical protein
MAQKDVRYIAMTKTGFYKIEMALSSLPDNKDASPILSMLNHLHLSNEFANVYTIESRAVEDWKNETSKRHSLSVVVLSDFVTITGVMDKMLIARLVDTYEVYSEDHYNSLNTR